MTYDGAGRVDVVAHDGTVNHDYNGLGMLEAEIHSGGTLGSRTGSWGYTANLLLGSVELSTHSETLRTFGYDGASRLTNVVMGGYSAGYKYHANAAPGAGDRGANGSTDWMVDGSTWDYNLANQRDNAVGELTEYAVHAMKLASRKSGCRTTTRCGVMILSMRKKSGRPGWSYCNSKSNWHWK